MRCPICDAREVRADFLRAHGHTLARCERCRFMWTDAAAPSYDDYGGYLFSQTSLDAEARSSERHWGGVLRDLLRRYGPGARLLDIGCGAGYFVHYARSLGFDAEGAEPSSYLRAAAREHLGLGLHPDASRLRGPFQVVTSFEVLEHVPHGALSSFMETVTRLLAPHGTFLGTTPNGRSLNVRLLGARDPVIWPPGHVSYFTPDALGHLFRGHGLAATEIRTYGLQPYRRVKDRPSFVTAPAGRGQRMIGLPIRALLYAGGRVLKHARTDLGYTNQFVAELR